MAIWHDKKGLTWSNKKSIVIVNKASISLFFILLKLTEKVNSSRKLLFLQISVPKVGSCRVTILISFLALE